MSDASTPRLGKWPAAKISVPSPRALAPRPRLRDALSEAVVAGGVILISAPGGSGKTSLLADWARHASVPVAWYALDAADRDTRRLLAGLCAAVERALPGAGAAALAALDGGGKESAAAGLLLGDLEGRRLVLVVDDFQHLDDVPDAVPLWDHLLRFKSSSLSLVVLSRSMPLFGFATLVLSQQISGFGREDLRFDEGEAAALLAAHGIDALESVPQMVRRSGGWAAGLLLLARTAPGKVDFLHARGDALMEHLGREIIGSLPPDLRQFMLESAALGAAAPEDADAVLGRSDSAAAYAEVAARGLFLERHDATYRYHDLFGECLVGVLRAEAPDRLRTIRRAAAMRWIDGGDLPRGLATLAADEEWGTVAAVLERERKTVWRQGLWGTALAYAERLPDEYRTPRLVTLAGHAREQRGEHEQALVLADRAMAAAGDDEEWLAPAALRAQVLVSARRCEEGIRSADAALTVAERIGHRAASMQLREIRGQGYLVLGKVADGRNDLLVALDAYERDENVMGQARVVMNLATQLVEAGRAREGERYLMRARELWLRVGDGLLGYNSLIWALVRALDGDYAAASDEVDKALRLAREGGMALLECEAMAALADVHACSGRAAEAESVGLAAANLALRLDLRTALDVAFRARITAALLRRDRAGARRLIDEARQVAFGPVEAALLSVAEGTLALRMVSYGRAIDILEGAAAQLEAANRPQDAARALLLSAEAAFVSGRVRHAEDDLNRMAGLVLPLGCEGYLRPLIRWTPRVLAKRRELRRLRRDARLLLDGLDVRSPMLTLLKPGDEDNPVNPVAPLPKVRISPFGVGLLEVDGRRVDLSVLSRRTREMLFYTVHLGRPARRDEIIEAVFDGSLSKQTSQSLWDASRHMRRLFGEQAWRPRGGTYNLDGLIENEERAFAKAAETALGSGPSSDRVKAAHHAMSIFGDGGYLEWCDSPWAGDERARVTGLAIATACALAGLYTESGQVEDAVATCRRAMGWDVLAEGPQLALMRALDRLGDIGSALLAYHNYRRVLDQEGLEPSTGLVMLAASLTAKLKEQGGGASKSRA